jgi:hypothetical protein
VPCRADGAAARRERPLQGRRDRHALDARTRSAETLALWARAIKLPFLAALREAQVYVRGVERGVTLFDLPADKVAADLAQWQPLLEWLEPALAAVHKPAIRGNPTVLRSAHGPRGAKRADGARFAGGAAAAPARLRFLGAAPPLDGGAPRGLARLADDAEGQAAVSFLTRRCAALVIRLFSIADAFW